MEKPPQKCSCPTNGKFIAHDISTCEIATAELACPTRQVFSSRFGPHGPSCQCPYDEEEEGE